MSAGGWRPCKPRPPQAAAPSSSRMCGCFSTVWIGGLRLVREAGIGAESRREDTEDAILLTIRIPKAVRPGLNAPHGKQACVSAASPPQKTEKGQPERLLRLAPAAKSRLCYRIVTPFLWKGWYDIVG